MSTKIQFTNLTEELLSTIADSAPPLITSIEYPVGTSVVTTIGGDTLIIKGQNFKSGCSVSIGNFSAPTISYVSTEKIIITTPIITSYTATGILPLIVTNPNGKSAKMYTGVQFSPQPTWQNSTGLLFTAYEYDTINFPITAVSDTTIINYSIISGSLPTGLTLSTTGVISGIPILNNPSTVTPETYTFTVRATDQDNQHTDRIFSISLKPEDIVWTSPTQGQSIIVRDPSTTIPITYTLGSGHSPVVTVSGLPGTMTNSNTEITGSPGTTYGSSYPVTITINIPVSGKSFTRSLTLTVYPPVNGQVEYTVPGTYTWVAPVTITSICVVCVGAGGAGSHGTGLGSNWPGGAGGGGGGLGWKNNIAVTPGTGYTVVVGAGGTDTLTWNYGAGTPGGDSYFISATTVKGGGGSGAIDATGATGGTYVGDGGGNGGTGGNCAANFVGGGGGGAGGYAGAGGAGGTYAGSDGTGGGGGGGGGNANYANAGGGGVGLLGQGANGVGGASAGGGNSTAPGTGGSSGANGTSGIVNYGSTTYDYGGVGGAYGGGGGGAIPEFAGGQAGSGGSGAVRIIWGTSRSFPSTNTGNL